MISIIYILMIIIMYKAVLLVFSDVESLLNETRKRAGGLFSVEKTRVMVTARRAGTEAS